VSKKAGTLHSPTADHESSRRPTRSRAEYSLFAHRLGELVASSSAGLGQLRGPCGGCHTRLMASDPPVGAGRRGVPNQADMCRNLGLDRPQLASGCGSTAVPRGQWKAGAWQGCAVRLSTFPHPRSSTAIQWLTCASYKSFTDPYTGNHAARRRAGVIGASWHACPGIGCEGGD
jgi:hypothetical protein